MHRYGVGPICYDDPSQQFAVDTSWVHMVPLYSGDVRAGGLRRGGVV